MIEQLKALELTLGVGENHFSMSRGSFKYKSTMQTSVSLRPVKTEDIPGGYRLNFEHPETEAQYSVEVTTEQGRTKVSYVSKDEGWNRFCITIPTNPKEKLYGCGETYSKFNLKGEKVRIWVAEHQNSNRIGKKILKEKFFGKHPEKTLPFGKYESYYVQPTFVSSDGYYVHGDVKTYTEFDFRDPKVLRLHFQEPPTFYVEEADSFPELSEKLSRLLGRQSALPDWIYDGAILAVQEGTETIEKKIQKAEAAGVKINGIWSQDWCGCRRTGFGYQVMWNWEWDRELYPNLDVKIQEWKEKGIRFLGYINPFLAIEKELYQHAAAHGYCVKDAEGKDYLVTITTFPAAMVDFTNPEAYEWYKSVIKENMIGLGMGGWMADFGEYLPTDAVLFSGEDAASKHNEWPAIWAKLNREAIEECHKTGEIFFFTRAGFTDTIRQSTMMWTGDQHVDWSVDDGLPSVIPASLSLAMSGFGISHSDVGGYTTIFHMRRSKELLMRWEEMNAFTPLFRSHEGNQPVNDVQFDDDEELLQQLAKTTNYHVNLKFYLQDLEREMEEKGTPMMRPIFYHYDEAWAYEEMTEYLLGRDLLVAPIIKEGATERVVRLPKDTWVHLFTEDTYPGGEVHIQAPMGEPPVFVRKDSPHFQALLRIKNR